MGNNGGKLHMLYVLSMSLTQYAPVFSVLGQFYVEENYISTDAAWRHEYEHVLEDDQTNRDLNYLFNPSAFMEDDPHYNDPSWWYRKFAFFMNTCFTAWVFYTQAKPI